MHKQKYSTIKEKSVIRAYRPLYHDESYFNSADSHDTTRLYVVLEEHKNYYLCCQIRSLTNKRPGHLIYKNEYNQLNYDSQISPLPYKIPKDDVISYSIFEIKTNDFLKLEQLIVNNLNKARNYEIKNKFLEYMKIHDKKNKEIKDNTIVILYQNGYFNYYYVDTVINNKCYAYKLHIKKGQFNIISLERYSFDSNHQYEEKIKTTPSLINKLSTIINDLNKLDNKEGKSYVKKI